MRILLALVVALTTLFLTGGCQSTANDEDEERDSQLPWSMPARWENSIIGVPY
jgi:hypothetical protein